MQQIGRYRVIRELARGGMGAVYLAHDAEGREFAIKVLLDVDLEDAEARERFQREASAVTTLDHPGILRVWEHGVEGGRPYTVMDRVPGRTLAEAVKSEGVLSSTRVISLGRQLAAALSHAHSRGIVHRDLKPDNVLLNAAQAPVIVDFGIARQLKGDATRLTETGGILGSPNYMAPEQAMGAGAVGPAADVYALGATLYYLLTGRPPIEGQGTLDVLSRVVTQAPTPPSQLCANLDPRLERVVLRCLEKAPEARFVSAFAVEQELAELAAHAPGTRRRWAAWIASAAALLAAGGLGLGWVLSTDLDALHTQLHAHLDRGEHAQALQCAEELLQRSPEARFYADRASAHAGLGDQTARGASLDLALELAPDNVGYLLHRAEARQYLNDKQGALADLERAIAISPENANAQHARARVLGDLGRFSEAVEGYSRALALDPDRSASYVGRAAAQIYAGDDARAIEDLTRLLEAPNTDLNLTRVRWMLGSAHANLGEHEQALAEYERVLESNPDDVSVLVSSGVAHLRLKQPERALERFTRAEELAPENPKTSGWRGSALTELGRYQEAIDAYTRSLELDPKPRTYRNRGLARVQLSQPQAGLDDLELALSQGIDDIEAWVARGRAKAMLGRHGEALEDYNLVLSRSPRHVNALAQRASCKAFLGQREAALEDYQTALTLDPENAHVHYLRAVVLGEADRVDEALRGIETALRLLPTHRNALCVHAMLLARADRKPEALRAVRRALQLPLASDVEQRMRALEQQLKQALAR